MRRNLENPNPQPTKKTPQTKPQNHTHTPTHKGSHRPTQDGEQLHQLPASLPCSPAQVPEPEAS